MTVNPIPDGFQGATPYLICQGAADALEFYEKAFGAEVTMRLDGPEGKIMHAEIKIGAAPIMLADEFPEMGFKSPTTLGGSPVGILIYVEDVNARFDQALEAGASVLKPLADQFYGDRSGTIKDPFGHTWTLATRIEDLSQEEMDQRFAEQMQQHDGS
jgi:PhnB protein